MAAILHILEANPPDLRSALLAIAHSEHANNALVPMVPDGQSVVDPLERFDYGAIPLAGLLILNARLSWNFSSVEPMHLRHLWDQCSQFCCTLDPLGLSKDDSERVNEFANLFLKLSKGLGGTAAAVRPLQALLLSWRESPKELTGVHAPFLEACVISRQYADALDIVNTPIEETQASKYSLTPMDHMRYQFFAGVCLAVLEMWNAAAGSFESVATTPAICTHVFQIAAYKKRVLIQLLQDGKTTDLPAYTSACLSRSLKTHGAAYRKLADVYPTMVQKGPQEFFNVFTEPEVEGFKKDKNYGLITKILQSILSKRILKLTLTYSDLTVENMCVLLGVPNTNEAEQELRVEVSRMCSAGLINARITSSSIEGGSPIVTFLPPSEDFTSPQVIQQIEMLNRDAEYLKNTLQEADRRIGISQNYLIKHVKEVTLWNTTTGMTSVGDSNKEEDLMEGLGSVGGPAVGVGGGSRRTWEDDY